MSKQEEVILCHLCASGFNVRPRAKIDASLEGLGLLEYIEPRDLGDFDDWDCDLCADEKSVGGPGCIYRRNTDEQDNIR